MAVAEYRGVVILDKGEIVNHVTVPLVKCGECALYHSKECFWNNKKGQDDYDFCSRAEKAVIK